MTKSLLEKLPAVLAAHVGELLDIRDYVRLAHLVCKRPTPQTSRIAAAVVRERRQAIRQGKKWRDRRRALRDASRAGVLRWADLRRVASLEKIGVVRLAAVACVEALGRRDRRGYLSDGLEALAAIDKTHDYYAKQAASCIRARFERADSEEVARRRTGDDEAKDILVERREKTETLAKRLFDGDVRTTAAGYSEEDEEPDDETEAVQDPRGKRSDSLSDDARDNAMGVDPALPQPDTDLFKELLLVTSDRAVTLALLAAQREARDLAAARKAELDSHRAAKYAGRAPAGRPGNDASDPRSIVARRTQSLNSMSVDRVL